MKTTASSSFAPTVAGARRATACAGVVLPTVLVLMLTVCLVVGLLSAFSIRSMRLSRRALEVERAFVVAEGGLGYGVMRVKQILNAEKVAGIRSKYQTITAPPSPDPDFDLVVKVVLGTPTDTHGSIDTSAQAVTVFAGARDPETGVACALRQVISLNGVSLSDYAIFYEGDFEASPGNGEGLHYSGKVHTNGDIWLTKKVTFDRNLTCHGLFHNLRKNTRSDDFQDKSNRRRVKIRYGDDAALTPEQKDASGDGGLMNTLKSGAQLNSIAEYWDSDLGDTVWSSEGLLYYGKAVQTSVDGVPRLDPPITIGDGNHTLIEPPLAAGDPDRHADTEAQKFANKAALYLKVHADGSYDLYKQTGTAANPTRTKIGDSTTLPEAQLGVYEVEVDTHGANTWSYEPHYKIKYEKQWWQANNYNVKNNGMFSTSDAFIDHRVFWIMKPVDIYLDQILKEGTATRNALEAAAGGEGKIDKILYIEMDDTMDPIATTNAWVRPHPCVRIRNGSNLDGCDLSIVTEQPVYLEGNFNTGGTWWTDPSAVSSTVPSAMIAADRVTVFSSDFQQYRAHDPYLGDKAYKDAGGTGKMGIVNEWNSERAKLGKWQGMGQMWNGGGGARMWQSETTSGKYVAAAGNTIVNCVIMTGLYPTIDANALREDNITPNSDLYYSGGLENILRMDEDWSNARLWFNGSVICLWDSEKPDYRWMTYAKQTKYPKGDNLNGNNWWAPPKSTMDWSYARMTPPGLPNFYGAFESDWARIPWSSVDWGDTGD